MAISSSQSVIIVKDYIQVDVTRNTSGDGTAVLAAPLANEYYIIDLMQLENLSPGIVSCTVKSGTRAVWSYRGVVDGGLLIDKPLKCDLGMPIYLNLDVTGSDVRIQALVMKITG